MVRPSSHAVYLGRAHYRHRLWQTIQENILVVGRSRSGKSGWLAKVIIRFRGAVVSATTKPDLFRGPAAAARRGRPVFKFDPQRIDGPRRGRRSGATRSRAARTRRTAMRRGTAFTDAVRTKGTEGGDFWSEQAALQMPALFCAAALAGLDLAPLPLGHVGATPARRSGSCARTGAARGPTAWRRCAAPRTRPPRRSAWSWPRR